MNDRDRLVELIRQVQYLGGLEEKLADHLIANGVAIPVRCCDCKHSKVNPDIEGTCYLTCSLKYGLQGTIDPVDYCPYGKRKEKNDISKYRLYQRQGIRNNKHRQGQHDPVKAYRKGYSTKL